jgi:hypothetical protein
LEKAIAVGCIVLGVLIFKLVSALNLKLMVWFTNLFFSAKTPVPGLLKGSGVLFFAHASVAAIFFGSVEAYKHILPPSPNSYENAMGHAALVYYPLAFLAVVLIFWKMLPATFGRSIILSFMHACAMAAFVAALVLAIIMIAYSGHSY